VSIGFLVAGIGRKGFAWAWHLSSAFQFSYIKPLRPIISEVERLLGNSPIGLIPAIVDLAKKGGKVREGMP
jgi:hypothetical protein